MDEGDGVYKKCPGGDGTGSLAVERLDGKVNDDCGPTDCRRRGLYRGVGFASDEDHSSGVYQIRRQFGSKYKLTRDLFSKLTINSI